MTHPKHKSKPKGKQAKPATPKKLPVGLRSAELIRDNRKSAVIVPVTERSWVAKAAVGEKIRMPIAFEGKGYIDVRVTGVCFHATLADIPPCERGHTVEQFDAEAHWHDVLLKAAWGSNRPVPVATMDERARKGWVVIDFNSVWFPNEWWAQAKAARETEATQNVSRPSGDARHDPRA